MMRYPRASYLAHQGEIDAAIARVLDGGLYILGEEVAAFEREFAGFLGVPDCAAVASGTDALELALRACDLCEGTVVVVPSFTAVGSVVAIERAGATPFLVDVDPVTLTVDVAQVATALDQLARQRGDGTPTRLGVVAVHLYGCPADVRRLRAITDQFEALLIEDCAQAHGARVQNCRVGTWGHAAAFSFYPTKNLGALGDGGAVASSRPEVVERVRLLRQYGWVARSVSETRGINSRLDEIQAAVLRVKLRSLDAENTARADRAAVYGRVLADTALTLPVVPTDSNHVFHQYVVRSSGRDALKAALERAGVPSAIHYPAPVHTQPAYRNTVATSGTLTQSERAAATTLSLPMSPHLPMDEVEAIAAEVRVAASAL